MCISFIDDVTFLSAIRPFQNLSNVGNVVLRRCGVVERRVVLLRLGVVRLFVVVVVVVIVGGSPVPRTVASLWCQGTSSSPLANYKNNCILLGSENRGHRT